MLSDAKRASARILSHQEFAPRKSPAVIELWDNMMELFGKKKDGGKAEEKDKKK